MFNMAHGCATIKEEIMKEFKKSVIETNINARKEEIAGYEVNVFNYEYMLPKITDEAFKKQIAQGIEDNKREMNKAKLVLEALYAQLESLEE